MVDVNKALKTVGGRKFAAFILGLTMAFILCLLRRIDGTAFVAAFAAGLGIFSTANVFAGKGGGASG